MTSKYGKLIKNLQPERKAAAVQQADTAGTQHIAYPRTQGKRTDEEFRQVSAYVRKATYGAVRLELMKDGADGKPREFSDLVEELLAGWLKERK